jgi:hypothetical protein
LWVVRSSADNYTANIGGFFSTPAESVWFTNEEIPFGANVQDQSSVTIRLYAYNANSALGTWTIDNLYIFGTVRDNQAPEFTTGFPQYDSTAVDGFDLLVNLSEAATVYYVVQDPAVVLTAPNTAQIIAGLNGDGLAADAADTITVTSALNVFNERVTGLLSDKGYDVYYVLYDSTNYSPVIAQTGIRTSDTNTILVAATQPAGPYDIPSTATDVADLVDVFNFQISDQATADGAPTHVTQLVFYPGSNNEADWATVIGGVTLLNETEGMYVDISNISISPAPTPSIIISIDPGNLTINNGETEELKLSILLTGTVTDNEQMEFMIGGNPHSNTTYTIGSQFNSTLTALTSNVYTITVTVDRLFISANPTNVDTGVEFSVTVLSTDANNNQDIDDNTTIVDLSRHLGTGNLTSTSTGSNPPQGMVTGGTITFSDVLYSGSDELFTIIASDNAAVLLPDTTDNIQVGRID